MPSKNVIRELAAGEYYHVFNRGIDKSLVFKTKNDYGVFLYYLESFLSDPSRVSSSNPYRTNYQGRVRLVCYCLMPNHYHLFVQQVDDNGLPDFMRALANAYTQYFNTTYDRVGPVFQGRYKAVRIQNDPHFKGISRYIHENPKDLCSDFRNYPYSSYKFFSDKAPDWIHFGELKLGVEPLIKAL